ncbi:MAG: hypothetical protein ACI3XM_10200 [Eubacteriales bacterium]
MAMIDSVKLAQKTKTLSAAVTAAGLLLFSALVGILTVTKNHTQLFSPAETENGKQPDIKSRITEAFDDRIVGFDRFLSVYGLTQRVLCTSVYEDAGYEYLICDKQDFLHYHTNRTDAAPYADAVSALYETLAENGIPLLYLQAPTKEIDGFTEYPAGIAYKSTENAADMADALRRRGVPVLSFAEAFSAQNTDAASLFYRTDHHWTTQTAFSAFAMTVSYLNGQYDLSLDRSVCDAQNWVSLDQPASFLGSVGRRLGAELAGLDDYTFLEPAFETSYEIYYPPESTLTPYWSGTFHDTIVRDSILYSDDVSANRYACYFQYDYGELIIDNLLCDNDLHVAIIKDSFALPFTAFLSTAVSRIDMIDLREFEGSVTGHLLDTKPDLVLILYSNGSFSPVMYRFDS